MTNLRGREVRHSGNNRERTDRIATAQYKWSDELNDNVNDGGDYNNAIICDVSQNRLVQKPSRCGDIHTDRRKNITTFLQDIQKHKLLPVTIR